jgi:Na+-translocating ferredoxin:NAD+ oxidoreductase RnfG subunit
MRAGGLRWAILLWAGHGVLAGPAQGQVLLTQEEALAQAFPPPARVERRTAFLTGEQLTRARALAGAEADLEQTVVSYYVAFRGDAPWGAAYFDVHRVRTLPEVLMIVITPEARVRSIEVLRFAEPPEYMAPGGWLEQFQGRGLAQGLSERRGIVPITGATLTSRAVSGAVRRALALHEVVDPFGPAGSGGTR